MSAWMDLLPLCILALGVLALIAIDAAASAREPGFLRGPALLIIAAAFVTCARQLGDVDLDQGYFRLAGFLVVDHLTVFCDLTLLGALAGIVAMAREHGDARRSGLGTSFGEREPALLLAGVGGLCCVHAGDLIVVWLGIELLTMATIVAMLATHDAVDSPAKRGALLGQLVPQAVASALMLLGIALVFSALGTTSLESFSVEVTQTFARWGGVQRWVGLLERYGDEIAARDPAMLDQGHSEIVRGLAPAALLLPGLSLMLIGVLAKLGVLPFARRRSLVQSGPLHVTALWSTVASVALISVLLRFFVGALHSPRLVNDPYGWTGALPLIALATGGWAAIAALQQRRLTRVITLLTTVQLSLILFGIVAAANFHGHIGVGARTLASEQELLWSKVAGDRAFAAVLVVMVAHVVASVGAFAAVASSRGFRGPEVRMQHWAGMASRRPGLALAFSICLLSLVGLPPLAGFVGKLGLMRALAEHSALRWAAVLAALELSLCAWVVVKIIIALYFGDESVSEPGNRSEPGPWPGRVAGLAALLSVGFGLGGEQLWVAARLPAAGAVFAPGDEDRLEWLEARREAWAERRAELESALEGEAGETVEGDAPVVEPGQMSVEVPAP